MDGVRELPSCDHGDHAPGAVQEVPAAESLDGAADLFRALGDSRRLRLLLRLALGEACVTQLAAAEDEAITTVSARLKALHTARLVKRRRDGKHMVYALADGHIRALLDNALAHAGEPHPR